MDLLFSKYASPFLLLDGYISGGRFSEFISEFVEIENEKTMWEYYLHKVHDKTFDEFKNSVNSRQNIPLNTENLETTVKNSQSILSGFIPQK